MSFWGIPVTVVAVPTNPTNTDISTVDTIAKMRRLAIEASTHPTVVKAVNTILSQLDKHSTQREIARAVYWFVKRTVQFVEDEEVLAKVLGYTDVHQELLVHPAVVLSMSTPMGDCDDFSVLTASLLIALKLPVKFVAIAADSMEPWRFSHVYTMAYLSDENVWVGMDTSHGNNVGWEYDGSMFRRAEWYV